MDEFTTDAGEEANRSVDAELARHERLVQWVVRRQWLGSLSFRDALHEGRIGLWAALCHYDPQRGTAFSTYAVTAIAHAVWRAVEVEERLWDSRSARAAGPAEADGSESPDATQVHAVLRDLIGQLPGRLQGIVVAHQGLDGHAAQSFAAIGAVLGVSRQRVHQLHAQAVLWLAHPQHSLTLRRLLGRCGRRDYQRALARQRQSTRQPQRRRAGR
jgi:RNA polymerase sigma factor (sigma-70 family)